VVKSGNSGNLGAIMRQALCGGFCSPGINMKSASFAKLLHRCGLIKMLAGVQDLANTSRAHHRFKIEVLWQ
jgi:hypothetical protein